MAARDEVTRRLAASVASNAYRANPDHRSTRRSAALCPDHLLPDYEAEVDPDRVLTARTRRLRANAAWRRDEAQRALDAHRVSLRDGGDDGGAAA